MNQLVAFTDRAHALIAAGGKRASYRLLEFFTANIRNPNTRRAYARTTQLYDRRVEEVTLDEVERILV
jgi:hypothetical protein